MKKSTFTQSEALMKLRFQGFAPKLTGMRLSCLAIIILSNSLLSCDKEKTVEKSQEFDKAQPQKHSKIEKFHIQPKTELGSQQPFNAEKSLGTIVESTSLDKLSSLYADLSSLVKSDPIKALRSVDQLPPGIKRDLLLQQVFRDFPKEKVVEALQWADNSSFKEDHVLIYPLLSPDSCVISVEEAIKLSENLHSEELRNRLESYAAWKIAADSGNQLDAAKAWTARLPAERQGEFLNQFVYGVISNDPSKGLSFILTDTSSYGEGLREAAARNAGLRCPETMESQLTERFNRSEELDLLKPYIQSWLSSDSTKASSWASKKLQGVARDTALATVVEFLVSKGSYDEAKLYRESILDQTIKNRINVP